MMNDNELMDYTERLMLDDETPPATKATLLRTLLELKGYLGQRANRGMTDVDESGVGRSAADIKRDIARVMEED